MNNSNESISLNNLLSEELEKYKNLEVTELKELLNISSSSKNVNRMIFSKIISLSSKKTEINNLLAKHKCVIKTVNFERNNLLKESMSLNVIRYNDFVKEEWKSSTLRGYFLESTFIFIVFKKTINSTTIQKIKVWKMPLNILDSDIKRVWEQTRNLVAEGKIVNYINSRGKYVTNFLKSRDTKYIHVRPHAQNFNDTFPLPVPDIVTGKSCFTKHSFWLNSCFIKKIILEGKYNG